MKSENLLFLETTGYSMWPFLKEKDKLIVEKVPLSVLRAGDPVLYRSDKQLICHRLIKKNKSKGKCLLYVRADASLGPPEIINEEKFLGKVIGVVRNNKAISLDGLKQRLVNKFILIVAPILYFIVKIYRLLLGKK